MDSCAGSLRQCVQSPLAVATDDPGRNRPHMHAATRIGTTGRGIGPAYEDKVGRRAIRLGDLDDLPALNGKIDRHKG